MQIGAQNMYVENTGGKNWKVVNEGENHEMYVPCMKIGFNSIYHYTEILYFRLKILFLTNFPYRTTIAWRVSHIQSKEARRMCGIVVGVKEFSYRTMK